MGGKLRGKRHSDELQSQPESVLEMVFEDIVRENIAWMLVVARRILTDQAISEDAVQEAFSKIHKNLDGFEGRSSLRTWMHRVVVNEALMLLRKQKRRKRLIRSSMAVLQKS